MFGFNRAICEIRNQTMTTTSNRTISPISTNSDFTLITDLQSSVRSEIPYYFKRVMQVTHLRLQVIRINILE